MRLIDADELKKTFEEVYPLATNEMGGVANKRIYDIIDNAPTVEGEILTKEAYSDLCLRASKERPQGEWIKVVNKISERETETHWECSKCHNPDFRLGEAEFCSFCGAEMQKGGAE